MFNKDILHRLSQIKPAAELTYLSEEHALRCEYITSEGYRSEWISADEWPVYQLENLREDQYLSIQMGLKNHALKISDIADSPFLALFNHACHQFGISLDKKNIDIFLANIANVPYPKSATLYAFYVLLNDTLAAFFTSSMDELAILFYDNFITDVAPWCEFDANEIQELLSRIDNKEFQGIPYYEF